jgi:FkbM family methyltransferase
MADWTQRVISIAQQRFRGTWLHRLPGITLVYRLVTRRIRHKHESVLFRGLNITIPQEDVTVLPGLITGNYERFELDLFEIVCGQSQNVVDVGANVGLHSLIASRRCGEMGKVWAFEPVPENLKHLRRNLEVNLCGNVFVVESAVGDTIGLVQIAIDPRNSGTHSIGVVGLPTIEVPITALDTAIPSSVFVDVLKVDVEGYECAVINGASALLRNHPTLFIEFVPSRMVRNGHDPEKLIDLLLRNYKWVFVINERSSKLEPVKFVSELKVDSEVTHENLFCVDRTEIFSLIEHLVA